jgi:hypothetical protein
MSKYSSTSCHRSISNGFDLSIISSSWKLRKLSPSIDRPLPLPQRLQPPLPILINILSYIEHEVRSRDAPCGVNKQWLMASQQVPDTTVRWRHSRSWLYRITPFELIIRKHPHVTSLIDFPLVAIKSLLDTCMTSFDLLSLKSLSLGTSVRTKNRYDVSNVGPIDRLLNRLSFSSTFESLTLNIDDKEVRYGFIIGCYKSTSKLLDAFNSANSFTSLTSTNLDKKEGPPRIRLNGDEPHRCGANLHEWTWSMSCSACAQRHDICCVKDAKLSSCDSEAGCCKPMVGYNFPSSHFDQHIVLMN